MSKGAADTQTQSTAVTGGNSNFVAASGVIGSGTLSNFAGPWYVETQTLNIDYVRVPNEQYWNNTCNATLSGLSTTHGNIQSTKLLYTYTATYDAAVVYQNFNTSSVQQPQEFRVVAASGDPNGVAYGSLNASTLGPMGSIITTTPYIRRTAYTSATSATQPVVSKVSTGASFGMYDQVTNVVGSSVVSSITMVDGTTFFTDLNYWSQYGPNDPVGNASLRGEKYFDAGAFYNIPGAYDTGKELLPLSNVIDTISNFISNQQLFNWPVPNVNTFGYPARDTGLPEYDKNRHA
tara:strand:- start:33 stop:908 length:876 start_codon:yes stop_codon:yes gene_type:complete